MIVDRRRFLKIAAAGAASLAGLWPWLVRALAPGDRAGFLATELDEAIAGAYPDATLVADDGILLDVPTVADNGAMVPVTVGTTRPDVRSISIFVEHNPNPMVARFHVGKGVVPEFTLRMKMNETSRVVAVVQTEGGVYSTGREVTVTVGGCAV